MLIGQSNSPVHSGQPCCSIPDISLDVDFFSNEEAWEDCTVVSGAATVSIPDDGSTGTVEACITIPVARTSKPNLELYDQGDFTSSSFNGAFQELCKTVTYPLTNDQGEVVSFETISFYVVPIDGRAGFSDIVTQISGSLSNNTASCDCDNSQNGLSIGFRPRFDAGSDISDPSDDVDRTYFIPNGANLSDLISAPGSNLFMFQDPSVSGNFPIDIILQGELNVDIDYVMGVNGNNTMGTLTLGPNSKINVLEDHILEIRNTEIAGCGTLWESITVEEDATLLLSNSIITNGKKAITVLEDGELVAKNTEFKNNEVGIYVPEDPEEDEIGRQDADIKVFGCSFDFRVGSGINTSEPIFPPTPILLQPLFGQTPRAGAEFNDVRHGGIVFARNEPTFRRNVFTNIANGIIFNESGGSVTGSKFEFIKSPVGQSPVGNGVLITGAYKNTRSLAVEIFSEEDQSNGNVTFTSMETAVRVDGGYTVRVEGTTMNFVENGLYATEANLLRFNENTVNSSQYGFRRDGYGFWGRSYVRDNLFTAGAKTEGVNDPSAIRLNASTPNVFAYHHFWENDIVMDGAVYGVFSESTNRLRIRNNAVSWKPGKMFQTRAVTVSGGSSASIYGNFIKGNTGEAFTETSGITVNSTNRPSVTCNTIEDIESQITFWGSNQNAKINGNYMLNGGVGLQYGDPILNSTTFTGPQIHEGNQWVGPFVGFGAAIYNTNTIDLQLSRYTVDTGDDPTFLPSLNPGASSWFLNDVNSPEPFYKCPINLPPNQKVVDGFNTVEVIVNENYTPGGKWKADIWTADNRVIRNFRHGLVDSTQHANWNTWKNSSKVNSIQPYQEVESLLGNEYNLSEQEEIEIDDLFEEAEALQKEFTLATIDRYQNPSVDTVVVDNLINATRVAMVQNQASFDTLFSVLKARKTQRLDDAEIINNTLTNSTLPATLQQEMNTYSIAALRNDLKSLIPYQANIVAIAEECPLDGGEAVYQARAVAYSLDFPMVIDAQENCINAANQQKSVRLKERTNLAQIYPNPAQQEIRFSLSDEPTDRILISDMNGKVVKEINFTQPVNSGIIPLPRLASGIYIVAFQRAGKKTTRQLLTIQK